MSSSSAPVTDWDQLGIQIGPIAESMYPDVISSFYQHFCPDEPLCRSIGLGGPGRERNIFMDDFVIDSAKDGVMATDKEGNLLGVRLGKVVKRGQVPEPSLQDILGAGIILILKFLSFMNL